MTEKFLLNVAYYCPQYFKENNGFSNSSSSFIPLLFLVGASLVKRVRLIQWLVFFFFSSFLLFFFSVRLLTNRVCTTFCELFTFTKSTQCLILNAPNFLYLEMQNPESSPSTFLAIWEFLRSFFGFLRLFFEFFKSLKKGPASICFGVFQLKGC